MIGRERGSARSLAIGVLLASALSLSACSSASQSGPVPPPTNVAEETTEVLIVYSTGRTLYIEPHVIDAKNEYQSALNELLAATPEKNTELAIVQPDAKVRSVKVADGIVTVDWDRSVLDFQAEPQEKFLAWASIMETLGQFPEVKKVQFTVEGKTSGQIDGKDVRKFWGRIVLDHQPWDAVRPPTAGSSTASTSTGSSSGTSGP